MATDYRPYLDQMADKYGVPRWLARAIYEKETKSGKDVRTSPKGAKGHMQLMPATAKALGVKDINDPRQNMEGAAKLLNELLRTFKGDAALAAAAYNSGPTKVRNAGNRVPNIKETRDYVDFVSARNPAPGAPVPVPSRLSADMAKAPTSNNGVQLKDVRIVGDKPKPKAPPAPTLLDQFKRGTGLATRSMIEGAGEAIGLVGDPLQYFLNKAYSAAGVPKQYLPQLPSEMGRTAATKLNLPTPQTGLERTLVEAGKFVTPVGLEQAVVRGGQRLARTGLTAAQQALARGTRAAGPSVAQRVVQQVAANPLAQATTATAAGLAAGGAGELTSQNPYAELGAALTASALTGGPTAKLENALTGVLTPEGRDAIRLQRAAEAQGINVTASDVFPGMQALRRVTGVLENIPFLPGMRDMRQQNIQTRAAVERLRDSARPYNVSETATAKDMGKIIINDLRDQYKSVKAQAGALYDAVLPALNAKKGTDQIAVSNAKTAITNFLKEFPNYLRDPDVPTSVKNLMQKIAKADDTQVIPYSDFRRMNTAFGQAASEAERAAAIGGKGSAKSSALSQVYSALSRDADAWVTRLETQNPEAATAFRNAQGYFTENVLPFRDTKLVNDVVGRRLKPTEIDNVGEKFVNGLLNADEGVAQNVMRLSSDQGQSAARFALLDKATSAAVGDQALSEITPMTFFRNVDPSNPTNAAILGTDPDMLARTSEVAQAASAARRSTEAFANPMTGNRAMPFIQAGLGAGLALNAEKLKDLSPEQQMLLVGLVGATGLAPAALSSRAGVRALAGKSPEMLANPALLNPAMISLAQFAAPSELPPVSAVPKPAVPGAMTPQQEQEIMQSEAFQYLSAPEEINYTTGESTVRPAPSVTIDLDPKSIKTINPEDLPEDF